MAPEGPNFPKPSMGPPHKPKPKGAQGWAPISLDKCPVGLVGHSAQPKALSHGPQRVPTFPSLPWDPTTSLGLSPKGLRVGPPCMALPRDLVQIC